VRHYWIVDPRAQTLECFRLESSTYRLEASGAARDEVTVPSFDGLVVALEGLWLDGGTRR
jgi:Uma2 family endonuclease